ncbi:Glycosyl transferases group 1 [Devosia crocina]|uniref:Glycosyl transferases group 1 n=1 Tax=Devosia crocina TaxID=429728 RepID=A0A1I7NUX7_9HYPH|nr:glycosyltransferase [Devosia crocina]SFV38476.1 Glycosyl transferases group 1 [Devosia crocina]
MSVEGLRTAIVVISDRVEHEHSPSGQPYDTAPKLPPKSESVPPVIGGYLERLPLAAVQSGLAQFCEIWHHDTGMGSFRQDNPYLARRVFPLTEPLAPFHSESMIEFVKRYGAPRILCVWGLGVGEALLEVCRESLIIYNSIDAPALRVPPEISRHFDAVLTGAQWQSDVVADRHSDMPAAIMPVGPEFASPETFFPTGAPKRYDIIYVAAAQPYKRHDILFRAMARAPRPLTALCVMGYGENAAVLRAEAHALGVEVDFIEPPGVSHADVNRLMNETRVGVVCGVEDGAPAILTEYMLAGLPVVANAELACGLQYITPETGIAAPAERFEHALIEAIDHPDRFSPRQTVLDCWTWPHTTARFEQLLSAAASRKQIQMTQPQGASVEPAASA